MNNSVNGWDVLGAELGKISNVKEIIRDVFGDNFNIDEVASGEYLLYYEDVEYLLAKLGMPHKTEVAFLNSLITNRIRCGITVDIESFQELFCRVVNAFEKEIPCAGLETLKDFMPATDNFYEFVQNKAEDFLKMDLPANSCALKIAGDILPALPAGSVVIVNQDISAEYGISMILGLDENGNFILQNFTGSVPAGLKWYIPVIQINFILS